MGSGTLALALLLSLVLAGTAFAAPPVLVASQSSAPGPAATSSTAATAGAASTSASTAAAFDPAKVTDDFVAGGNWTKAVSADWLGNGHMVVLTQGGMVYDVTPSTGAQRVLLDLTAKVNDAGEAGSLDVLVDRTGSGFWIYYTVAGSDRLRISHFTVGSSAETVVWTNPGLGYNTANPYHVGGALDLGPDGKLYLSVGDRVEGRSNDLTNVFGKVLRINTDGTVPADNPFHDGAGPHVDEIWAHGLRNPYRAAFDRTTGLYWVGDVGGNIDTQAYEEVDIVEAGKGYGWPTCEGPLGLPKNGPVCPAGVTGPVHSYSHDVGAGCCSNRAIVGGEVYRGSVFPLQGHYLFADYAADTFSWLQLGADGRTAVADGLLATASASTPVWMGVGPDGYVYWLSFGWSGNGQLRRLGYSGGADAPPTITTASSTPRSGPAPLAVRFTGVASDPDGTPVTYAWDFGDGSTSTQASPTHTYASSGRYSARLRVSSGGATVSSDPIPIVVGAPPTATITGPSDGTTFDAGQRFTMTGTGHDPGTGALPGSALSWEIRFLHNEHSHPGASGTGSSITFTVPSSGHDFAGTTRYEVSLTATDPDGLTDTSSIVLEPNKTTVAVRSDKAGSMTVDNVTQTLPHTVDTLVGFRHVLSVPTATCVGGTQWTFSSWSDGGAQTHTITATHGLELTATYVSTATACGTSGPPPSQPTSPPTQPTTPPPSGPDEARTERIAGANRYETAAAIVRESFPTGPVPVVFIATGETFADALAGGPAADALGGPVLPVAENALPAPVRGELTRLQPGRIVVLGGPGAVSDTVARELEGFTTGTVTRLAGADRYGTAARVATEAFASPVAQVLIATGSGFADALAGGSVGAKTDSPVLLVTRDRLPAETAAALRQLQPRDIAVIGGTSAVSDAVVQALQQYAVGGAVTRLSGSDRYATAARLAQAYWPQTASVVYLATGRNFPDALSGVPAAGRDSAPLLLVEPTCMPAATKRELDRLRPTTIVVLGGTAAVSAAAAAGTVCTS